MMVYQITGSILALIESGTIGMSADRIIENGLAMLWNRKDRVFRANEGSPGCFRTGFLISLRMIDGIRQQRQNFQRSLLFPRPIFLTDLSLRTFSTPAPGIPGRCYRCRRESGVHPGSRSGCSTAGHARDRSCTGP